MRPDLLQAAGTGVGRPSTPRPDLISTESAARLRTELARQPEVRPEVVARAKELAADPTYPPSAIVRAVALQILAAPDLSEAQS